MTDVEDNVPPKKRKQTKEKPVLDEYPLPPQEHQYELEMEKRVKKMIEDLEE